MDATSSANAIGTLHTNETLNLSVLRRHNPSIVSVLSIASYAVVYNFAPATGAWEKSGIEGTLFVCQLAPSTSPRSGHHQLHSLDDTEEERYATIVLNRRGLENFFLELRRAEDVDIGQEFIIVQRAEDAEEIGEEGGLGEGTAGTVVAYGLWIYCEEGKSTAQMRDVNARIMLDCATRAEESRALLQQRRIQDGKGQSANSRHVTGIDGSEDGHGQQGLLGISHYRDPYNNALGEGSQPAFNQGNSHYTPAGYGHAEIGQLAPGWNPGHQQFAGFAPTPTQYQTQSQMDQRAQMPARGSSNVRQPQHQNMLLDLFRSAGGNHRSLS